MSLLDLADHLDKLRGRQRLKKKVKDSPARGGLIKGPDVPILYGGCYGARPFTGRVSVSWATPSSPSPWSGTSISLVPEEDYNKVKDQLKKHEETITTLQDKCDEQARKIAKLEQDIKERDHDLDLKEKALKDVKIHCDHQFEILSAFVDAVHPLNTDMEPEHIVAEDVEVAVAAVLEQISVQQKQISDLDRELIALKATGTKEQADAWKTVHDLCRKLDMKPSAATGLGDVLNFIKTLARERELFERLHATLQTELTKQLNVSYKKLSGKHEMLP